MGFYRHVQLQVLENCKLTIRVGVGQGTRSVRKSAYTKLLLASMEELSLFNNTMEYFL